MAPRVFIGLTEVAGYFRSLEAGLREAGIKADFRDLSANPLGYGAGASPGRGKGTVRLLSLAQAPHGSPRGRLWAALLAANRLVRAGRSLVMLPFAIARYDVFILAGGGMFLDGRELRVLRRLGKVVIVVFTGSDHRPPYINGIWVRDAEQSGYGTIARDARRIRNRVRRVERWATAVVALPSSAQFHVRPFIDFLAVGIPFRAPPEWDGPPRRSDNPSVRILHCPTSPASKGSFEIRATISRLRGAGLPIEYEEITGRPHREVLAALAACDFVVDELYSDTPMARFATEAAWCGRPAVVGGYYALEAAARLGEARPPTLFVLPEDAGEAIERLCRDAGLREDLGARAAAFVRDHWSPAAVAARYLVIIQGTVPTGWMVSPPTSYVHGWGLDETLLARSIAQFVREFGPAVLSLDDSPQVRDAVLSLRDASGVRMDMHT